MNKLIKILMFGILPIGQVFASEDMKINCPAYIECWEKYNNLKECKLSNNPYEVWENLTVSANNKNYNQIKKGIYPLKEASIGIDAYSLSKTYCTYSNENTSFLIPINQNISNKFEPLINNSHNWIKKDNNSFKCDANKNSSLCPMTEKPEIVITNRYSMGGFGNLSFYTPDYNTEPGANYKTFNRLTYNQLITICGRTSNCIIDIGDYYFNSSEINHLGSVDIDISIPNKVKINYIYTDSWLNYKLGLQLQKKEPLNTIILNK